MAPTAPPPEGELHLRYLDWCSARVAERFQALSPEEVWERTHAVHPAPEGGTAGYLESVRLLTVELARELDLPAFDAWRDLYLRDPAPYDREMLGLGGERALDPTV